MAVNRYNGSEDEFEDTFNNSSKYDASVPDPRIRYRHPAMQGEYKAPFPQIPLKQPVATPEAV